MEREFVLDIHACMTIEDELDASLIVVSERLAKGDVRVKDIVTVLYHALQKRTSLDRISKQIFMEALYKEGYLTYTAHVGDLIAGFFQPLTKSESETKAAEASE